MSGSGLPTGTTTPSKPASFGAVRGATVRRTSGPRSATGADLASGTSASGSVVLGKCSLDSFFPFPFSGGAVRIFFGPPLPTPAQLRFRYHRAGGRFCVRRRVHDRRVRSATRNRSVPICANRRRQERAAANSETKRRESGNGTNSFSEEKMQFSERIGAVKRAIQIQTMSPRLRNRLWNVACRIFWNDMSASETTRSTDQGRLLVHLGTDFFGMTEDEIERTIVRTYQQIKQLALTLAWAQFYDLMEFIANDPATKSYKGALVYGGQGTFLRGCNEILEEELAGYRFVGTRLVPITNNEEIATVETALAQSGDFAPVSTHVATGPRTTG